MNEDYWSAVREIRLGIADQLDSLDREEWDAPSLCEGWRVRDVAGHVALVPTIRTRDLMSAAPRAGFNPHRINTLLAIRNGSRPPDQIVQEIRDHAPDRRTARALDVRNSLFDVIVHSQDIATPLGRAFPVPAQFTRDALQRVWEMGWPFHARRRLAGHALTADDVDWAVGTGPEIRGPAVSLLLLLTGRTSAAITSLSGPGVEALRA
jgi:uncharacterized protein (TIGR03083 family)